MPTTIIGVDFSGAKTEDKTWIAQGRLTDCGKLCLDDANCITRKKLYERLVNADAPAVVAMDFPFGLPTQFIGHIADPGNLLSTMDAVWGIVHSVDRDAFMASCTNFVANHGEPTRTWDARHFPESFSPIKGVNPNMRPMTYEGICLLQRLHWEHPQRWHVPPLKPTAPEGETITLLEVMPGAALRAVGLPHQNYKNNTGRRALVNLKNRKEIIAKLACKFRIALPNLQDYRDLFIFNDDALDAFIASIVAALWQKDKTTFHHPEDHCDTVLAHARNEGCIYAPSSTCPTTPQCPNQPNG